MAPASASEGQKDNRVTFPARVLPRTYTILTMIAGEKGRGRLLDELADMLERIAIAGHVD